MNQVHIFVLSLGDEIIRSLLELRQFKPNMQNRRPKAYLTTRIINNTEIKPIFSRKVIVS